MVQEVKFPERKDIPSMQKKKEVGKEQQGFSQLFDQAIESESQVVSDTSTKKNNGNDNSSKKDAQAMKKEENVLPKKEDGIVTEEKEVCKDGAALHLLQSLVTEQFQFQFQNEGFGDGKLEEQIVNIGEISNLKEDETTYRMLQEPVVEEHEDIILSQGENIDSENIFAQKNKKKDSVEEKNVIGAKIDQDEEEHLSLFANKDMSKIEKSGIDTLKSQGFNQQEMKVEKRIQMKNWSDRDELEDSFENSILSRNFVQERIGDYPRENIKVASDTKTLQNTAQASEEILARNGIELKENLVEKMTQSLAQNQYEMELTLNPENLGKMSIRISYINEKATIAILCSSKEASQMLAEQAKEIGRIMEQHLKADTFIAVDSKEQDYLEQNLDQSKEQHNQQDNRQKKRTYNTQEETQTFMEQLRLGLA